MNFSEIPLFDHITDQAPEKCPVCGVPAEKFKEMKGEMEWAAEHVVGVAKDVDEDIKADLRANLAIILISFQR